MLYRRYVLLLVLVALVTVLAYRFFNQTWISFHHAETLRAQKDYSAAAPIYRKLWDSGLKSRPVFERLSESLFAMGDFTGVIQVCRGALAGPSSSASSRKAGSAPEDIIPDWIARWALARALSYSGQFDASIKEYRIILQTRPELNEARLDLAEILYGAGRHAEALRELRQVPDDALNAKARLLMGDLYAAAEDYDAAELSYRLHLEQHPRDADARLKLANVLSWSEQYDQALVEFETVLEQNPDDIQARRQYANVLMWAGRNKEAVVEFRKTLKSNP